MDTAGKLCVGKTVSLKNSTDLAHKQGINRAPSRYDPRFIVYRVKIKANESVDIPLHLIYEGSSESRVLALFNTT